MEKDYSLRIRLKRWSMEPPMALTAMKRTNSTDINAPPPQSKNLTLSLCKLEEHLGHGLPSVKKSISAPHFGQDSISFVFLSEIMQ